MKIVKINGGLGNQMFQYAFARSLAARTADAVYIDRYSFARDDVHNGYELDRLFNVRVPEAPAGAAARLAVLPTNFMNRVRRKYFTKRTHFIDKKFGYQPELFALDGDRYYEGYWQSEKYFKDVEEEIRRDFAFKKQLAAKNSDLLERMQKPIASVHVRRGDYLKHPNLDICTRDYYARAIDALSVGVGVASFMVFSDDIEYCRTNLDTKGLPIAFVDWNRGTEAWQDMAMMAYCDCHITANSSFSWWGAWLDPKAGKRIIAPSVWNRREIRNTDRYYSFTFGDIVPESWERVAI